MPFSYSGNPGHSSLDAVRFLIGDTDPSDVIFQDAELAYLIAQYAPGAVINAAIQACEAALAKFARLVDEKAGGVDLKFSQKTKQYTLTRDELRRRLLVTDMNPFCGGISIAQKEANRENTDTVRPDFTKHMMENHQNSSGPFTAGNGGLSNGDGNELDED